MIKIFKQYALAIFFLFVVVLLMLASTLGVERFGDKMLKDANITVLPTSKKVEL